LLDGKILQPETGFYGGLYELQAVPEADPLAKALHQGMAADNGFEPREYTGMAGCENNHISGLIPGVSKIIYGFINANNYTNSMNSMLILPA